MEEYNADHTAHSVGGTGGHWFRRAFHVGMAIIPLAYYGYGETIVEMIPFFTEPIQFVAAVGLFFAIAEAVRIKTGFLIVGQRHYEKHQLSALGWGAVSLCICIIALEPWTPSGVNPGWLGYPLIFSLTFVDPILGEARRAGQPKKTVLGIGVTAALVIWAACAVLVDTPWLLVPLMAPLVVAAETPKLKWIDDNATMLLIPLGALLLLLPLL